MAESSSHTTSSTSSGPVALMQQLHDEHAGALWGYCLRLTGHDRAHAEDLLQETLLRAWRSSRLLDESRGSVRSWLFTVARNLAIDEWRTKRTRTEVAVAEPPEPDRRHARPHRPAAAVVGGRRRALAAQRRPPRRARVLLLPRHVGRRRRPPARRPRRNREVPHPLRPARPAPRPRGDGGDAHERLPAVPLRRRLRPRLALAGRPARVRAPPARLRALPSLRRRAGRPARACSAGCRASRSRPRSLSSRCPRRCCPPWWPPYAASSAARRCW